MIGLWTQAGADPYEHLPKHLTTTRASANADARMRSGGSSETEGSAKLAEPMSETNLLAELKERRNDVLLKLRDREPELVAQLIQLNAAISGMEAESKRVVIDHECSGFRRPSDALISYLNRAMKPQDREAMCQVLVSGGYGHGTKRPYWDLIRAVDYQIKTKRWVEINGLVGKADWPKKMFLTARDHTA